MQIIGVNQAQSRNTMDVFAAIMSETFKQTYDVQAGVESIRANGGRQQLWGVTSNPRALEGKRVTFAVLGETQHWIAANKGHEMYKVTALNARKVGGRFLAITNAYEPGEDSVAQIMREGYEKALEEGTFDGKMLYDSVEAHPQTPLTAEAMRIVFPKIRGDAIWSNVDDVIPSLYDPMISKSRNRRMWFNQIVADEDSLIGPADWSAIEPQIGEDEPILRAGEKIVLGFDGGKTDDSTALVAIRINDGMVFLLCLEEKPEGPAGEGWHVNVDRVESEVHLAFRLYNVQGFYADVAQWESQIDNWAEQYRETLSVKASERHAIAWDMRASQKKNTMAHERLLAAVFDKAIRTDGNPKLRRHALNARRRENNFGVSFGKESRESPKKVDAYAALMLAHEAYHDFRTGRAKTEKKPRTGRGYFL